jgi:hypothetical protein
LSFSLGSHDRQEIPCVTQITTIDNQKTGLAKARLFF